MKDAKIYLMQVQIYDQIINSKLQDLAKLKDMITKITPSLSDSGGSSGNSQDKLGDTIAKIVDLENEINEEIDAFIEKRRSVARTLLMVKDPNQFAVLHGRYMLSKSFEQIAFEMHMTYRNICYIHGKGLQSVEKILKGSGNNGKTESNAVEIRTEI